ncbi:MAG TPA: CoA pyrophosphatase [Pedomonas sp.]|uniref:CoA pyrophosphatase n=1 Tax=Pedomonas sp. TaxID=2976421 RepID=UPI002F419FBA
MTLLADVSIEVVRQRLVRHQPADCTLPHRGDHELNPDMPFPLADSELKLAAVLIPIVNRPDGPTVLLTQRVETLRAHAGQIAFPGGRLDTPDETPFAAALREAQEEVGLEPERVEIITSLDCYRTRTGYNITPVVGIVQPGFSLTLQEMEVADAFEVPLSFLIDPERRIRESRVFQGVPRFFYAIPYGPRYIWGATAGIIVNLAEVLLPHAKSEPGLAGPTKNAQGAIS